MAGPTHSHDDKVLAFALSVKTRRLELGFSVSSAARGVGMSRRNWARLERGRAINMTTAFRVAEALSTTVSALLRQV